MVKEVENLKLNFSRRVGCDLSSGVLTDRQRASIDAIRNKVFLYILVFLICWSPGKRDLISRYNIMSI